MELFDQVIGSDAIRSLENDALRTLDPSSQIFYGYLAGKTAGNNNDYWDANRAEFARGPRITVEEVKQGVRPAAGDLRDRQGVPIGLYSMIDYSTAWYPMFYFKDLWDDQPKPLIAYSRFLTGAALIQYLRFCDEFWVKTR